MRTGQQASDAERIVEIPRFTIEAAVLPSTINRDDRTVDIVLYSGAPIARYDWESGQPYSLTLSLRPADVRLSRLNDDAPILANHDTYDLDSTIGAVVPGSGKIADGQLVATARFARDDEDADKVWNKVQQRILTKISVGAWIYRFEQTDATPTTPMSRHATDWEPFEGSVVPIGADSGARVLAADTTPKKPCVIVRAHPEEIAMPEPTPVPQPTPSAPTPQPGVTPPAAPGQPVAASHQPNPADPGAPAGAPREPEPASAAQIAQARERERVQVIMRAVQSVGLRIELANDLIASGVDVIEAQRIVIENVAARGNDHLGPRNGPPGAVVTSDGRDHLRLGIRDALLHRMVPHFFPLTDSGKGYRGRQILQLAEYYLQAEGMRTTHMSPLQIASAALGFQVQATGMHTTSDFVNILADVANKSLLAAYEAAPQTFLPLIRRAEQRDFKPVRRTRISEFPGLQPLGEHGEIQAGTMSDAKEQYQIATYAVSFSLSRESLINDDTNAFADLAIAAGQAARDKESDLVWAQLTSNPVMGDGVVLFHTDHGNISGAAAVISETTIGAGRAAMRQQKNTGGRQHINVAPVYLIVPTALETTADKFVSTALVASAASSVNPFAGKLNVIAEPRLDTSSASVWYLGASPTQIPMIELAFLSGQNGPMIESRSGWEVQGLEMKVVHDIAAKAMDWKGFFRNAA